MQLLLYSNHQYNYSRLERLCQGAEEEGLEMEILLLFVGLLALDIASFRWGADSRDGVNSKEWRRMADWRGFHGISK
jgi:hypothetical protein